MHPNMKTLLRKLAHIPVARTDDKIITIITPKSRLQLL